MSYDRIWYSTIYNITECDRHNRIQYITWHDTMQLPYKTIGYNLLQWYSYSIIRLEDTTKYVTMIYNTLWYDNVRYDMTQCNPNPDMIVLDTVWYNLIMWHNTLQWYHTMQYDIICNDMTQYDYIQKNTMTYKMKQCMAVQYDTEWWYMIWCDDIRHYTI